MHVHPIVQDSQDLAFLIVETIKDDVPRDQEAVESNSKIGPISTNGRLSA